jgi:sodium transport system permease protein
MPAYFIGIAPALVGAVGERALTNGATLVPGMNVTLLARELLLGKAQPLTTALVLVSTALCGCIALAFAARVYDSERFIDPAAARAGKTPASVPDSPPTAGQALLAFSAAFLLLIFVFIPWQKRDLVRGLLASQWLGMLGVVVVLARATRRRLPAMLALRPPDPRALIGAILIGASAWAAVALLSEWLIPVPKEVIEQLRRALVPQDQSRGFATNLLLVALTPAVCEEALFRGVVVRGLATRLAPSAAVVVTGVLFGLFHLDLYRLFPSTALGILLSWLALTSGSLVPSMVAHFLNNAILISLATLGLDQRLGTLGRSVGVAVFVVAAAVSALGIWLVRKSERA